MTPGLRRRPPRHREAEAFTQGCAASESWGLRPGAEAGFLTHFCHPVKDMIMVSGRKRR